MAVLRHFQRLWQREVTIAAAIARARHADLDPSLCAGRLGKFLHFALGVFALVMFAAVLDHVADVGPGNAVALHDALHFSKRIAALAAAGAQHAKQLRDPFLAWTEIGHGGRPSSKRNIV